MNILVLFFFYLFHLLVFSNHFCSFFYIFSLPPLPLTLSLSPFCSFFFYSLSLPLSLSLILSSSVLSVPPLSSGPVIHCLLILDPLSTSSQKLSPLLGKLKDLLPLNITVLFNPVTKLSALPLKE